MKIVCFTDSLGSGGAQRQLTLLAVLLNKRGHEVQFITYNAGDYFAPQLAVYSIQRIILDVPMWKRPIALRQTLRKIKPDAVIAFQESPSFYAEIASLGQRKWHLIVSERNAMPAKVAGTKMYLLRKFHILANVVTTNSVENKRQIEAAMPSLRDKIVTIYNAVDLDRFRPSERKANTDILRFVVLASHKPQKNFEGLAHAVRLLMADSSTPAFSIDWFGDEAAPGWLVRDQVCNEKLGVDSVIRFNPPSKTPEVILNGADALILPSLWEGLPNAVCESLSVGCPVLMSDVSDAQYLVQEGATGFLFDPCSPDAMANAIRSFLLLSCEQRQAMRIKARSFAEKTFDPERYVLAYETLLKEEHNQS